MPLYSNGLSIIATIYSLSLPELFPVCFSCSNRFNLLQISLGISGKNFPEIPEAIIAGD